MSEVELRQALRELTEQVKPAPAPYARLMLRARRRRLSHWITGFAAAVVALLLAPVALNAASDPSPNLGPIDGSVLLITPWTRKLIDAPARGGLAGDTAFLRDVSKVLRGLDSGPMHGYPTKVLFAEDVGDWRLVVAVRHSKTHQVGVAVAATRGAGAPQFATAAGRVTRIKSLTPFTAIEFGSGVAQDLRHAGVALAPPGCQVATSAADSPDSPWNPSPSGSYLVWSRSITEQLARVSCDGVSRYHGVLLDLDDIVRVSGDTAPYARAAIGDSGFTVPQAVMEQMLEATYPPQAIGPLRVLFGGAVPGMAEPVYVAAHPVAGNRWRVQVVAGSVSARLLTTSDVLAADAVVAVEAPNSSPDRMVVVAPRRAVKVEVREVASGTLLHTVALVNGVGSVASWGAEEAGLRAVDALGVVVGSGAAPLRAPSLPVSWVAPPAVQDWS